MSKIASIVEARMKEAAQMAASKTETDALGDLHRVAVDMSKIADQVDDRLQAMEAQVRMLNAPKPRPKPVPWYSQPVLLLQLAIGLLAVILLISGVTYMHSQDRTVCQQTQKPGVMLCKKI